MRYAKDFVLIKRISPKGKVVWYYRLRGQKVHHSTGRGVRWQAEKWIREEVLPRGRSPQHVPTLREYTAGFFDADSPWIRSQQALGRPFSAAMARVRRGHLKLHILTALGDFRLDSIRGIDVEAMINGLKLAAGTKNSIIDTLRIVLRKAAREGLISRSPMEDVERPGDDHHSHDAFTLAELARLFPADEDRLIQLWGELRWAAVHYLMVCTGIRVGEAAALRWRHHLADRSAILIEQAVKADGSLGAPKNGHVRAALYPSRCGELLEAWRAASPYREPDDFMFPGLRGERLATSTICRILTGQAKGKKRKAKTGVLERSGIKPAGRILTTHSLRATYNTRMRPRLPEAVLQYMMGHRSRAMTDRYDRATAEQRIGDLLAPVMAQIEQAWS